MNKPKIMPYICLVLTLISLIPNLVLAQQELNNYQKMASENNPRLKSLFQHYMAALERLPQAKALPDPQVAFGIFISPVETRVGAQRATISVSQMFPWFGQLKAQEQVEVQIAKSRYKLFEDAKFRLGFEVKATYNNLYVLREAIDITSENIELMSTFKQLAIVKFEGGRGSFVDVLRVEMEMAELENQLELLNDRQMPLQVKFKELLNTDIGGPVIFPDTLWQDQLTLNKQAIYDSILFQNPLLKKLDYQILSLEREVEVAQKSGMPSFNVGLNYINVQERTDVTIADNGKDAFILPQVGVRIPLYRKKYQAMIKEKEIKQQAIRYEKEDTSNKLATNLEEGYKDYLGANRRIALYQRLHGLAKQSLDILMAEYTSAGSDFEEILRMGRQVLKYALELEKARADQNTSVAYIQYLMGKY
ncbi:MAG: TolC family protein [Bacteroidetes bacterium]|nr:TolC family protein [Bacteroidota bacterium]